MKCKFCALDMIKQPDDAGYYCETLHYGFGDNDINEYITIQTKKYIMHTYSYDKRTHVFIKDTDGVAKNRFFVPRDRINAATDLNALENMLDTLLVLI